MVTRWGMSDKVGLVQLAPRANPFLGGASAFGADRPFSETTAHLIDTEVQRIIEESYAEASRLLRLHRKELDALVAALLKQETLDETQIREVTGLAADTADRGAGASDQPTGAPVDGVAAGRGAAMHNVKRGR
jgi:cell division protease FtsH